MYWREIEIIDAIDFLRFGKVKFNTVKKRHRVLNIVWYIVAVVNVVMWIIYFYGRL
jgi:hypothetical protein